MSIETDFRAMLAAYTGLTSLVGTRISKHAVEEGTPLPLVVFGSSSDLQRGMDDTVHAELVTFSVECWAATAVDAAAVAAQVSAAVDAYDALQPTVSVLVTARQSAYDGELKLDGEVLTVEWWRL